MDHCLPWYVCVPPDSVLMEACIFPSLGRSATDKGYVMVGDSDANSDFVQFRDVPDQDPDRGRVSHPDGWHVLFKIDPVTLPGFYPASMDKDPDAVHIGQSVTAVGYGMTRSTNSSTFPGEAYEAQVKVHGRWEEGVRYQAPEGAAAGTGAYGVLSSSIGLELANFVLTFKMSRFQGVAGHRFWFVQGRCWASR